MDDTPHNLSLGNLTIKKGMWRSSSCGRRTYRSRSIVVRMASFDNRLWAWKLGSGQAYNNFKNLHFESNSTMSTAGTIARSKRGKSVQSKQQTLRQLVVSAKITKLRAQQNRPPRPKTVYRRTVIFRPCVVRMVFFLPLAILVLERYLDTVFSLDDVRDVYYDQMGIDPEFKVQRINEPRDLANLTYTGMIQCPVGQRRMMVAHNPQFSGIDGRRIPAIVHQASKTRCLTRSFDRASLKWSLRKSSYYIHDEHAVKRLITSEFLEFPHLALISVDCISESILFGLWTYLVLWTYGGIFADLNSYPNQFNLTTLKDDDDGLFLLGDTPETLSTIIMAVSPRHPVMYYAVQRSLSNILLMHQNVTYDPSTLVGEFVLNQAVKDFLRASGTHHTFRKDKDIGLSEGLFRGVHDRSIRIAGRLSADDGAIVTPIFISPAVRRKEYDKIGMKNWEKPVVGTNCLQEILKPAS